MPSERLSYHAVGGPAAYIMLSSPHRVQDVLEKAFIDGQLDAELACGAQLRRWPVMVKLLNQRQAAQSAESKREETAKAIAMAQAARTDAEMASALTASMRVHWLDNQDCWIPALQRVSGCFRAISWSQSVYP